MKNYNSGHWVSLHKDTMHSAVISVKKIGFQFQSVSVNLTSKCFIAHDVIVVSTLDFRKADFRSKPVFSFLNAGLLMF